ncbi:hypothetical protein ACPIFS_004588, partial [Escherichia coli]
NAFNVQKFPISKLTPIRVYLLRTAVTDATRYDLDGKPVGQVSEGQEKELNAGRTSGIAGGRKNRPCWPGRRGGGHDCKMTQLSAGKARHKTFLLFLTGM